jgi:hypothetical protein
VPVAFSVRPPRRFWFSNSPCEGCWFSCPAGALVKKDDGVGVTTYAGPGYERYEIPGSRNWSSDDFNDGNADGWTPYGGTWAVESGAYSGSHTGGAVSLWDRAFQTGKLWAKVQTQLWSGHWHNGFLVFDYLDADNYKYAGLEDGSNRWVIKEAVNGSHYLRAELAETINTGQWYDLQVIVSGDTATLKVGGVQKVSHTFASGVQGGRVGLRVGNAHTHFDDVSASSQRIDDLRDGDAAGWSPSAGTWSVEGADSDIYSGQHTAEALSLWNQTMTWGRLAAGVTAVSWSGHWHNGFLVFDTQDGSHYKYAGMLAGSNTWVIKEVIGGTHYTRAELAETIQTGRRYALEVELSGDTATLRVDGQTKVSHTFASGIQGGQVGLRVGNAHTHVQEVALKRLVNVTQTYYLGGQRVALRRDGGLTYLLADHLGSTALTVDRNGAKVAELRYKASPAHGGRGLRRRDPLCLGRHADGV